MESYALLFAATLNAGTVLAIAALGLLINEKAGVVNLGAEGMMLCSAIAGFAAVVHTGSDLMGFAAGMGAGALLAAIFGVLVIWLNTNQYATGLALSLFGAGFSAFVGISYTQQRIGDRTQFAVPYLADLPFVGPGLFRHHPLVYLTVLGALGLAWFLYRSRAGLVLRAWQRRRTPATAAACSAPAPATTAAHPLKRLPGMKTAPAGTTHSPENRHPAGSTAASPPGGLQGAAAAPADAATAAAMSAFNLALVGATVALWPDLWAGLFTTDPAVLEYARQYLRVVGPMFPLFGAGLTLYFASQGAGKVLGPVLASFLRLAVVAVAGWWLARNQATPQALFVLVGAAMAIYGLTTALAVKVTPWGRG